MSNPARELAELLKSWNGKQASVSNNRATALGENVGTPGYWTGIDRAVILVQAYEHALDALEKRIGNVDHFRNQLPSLHECIYAPNVAWNANSQNSGIGVINQVHYNLLMAAAQVIDSVAGLTTGEPDLQAVAEQLNQARDLASGLTGYVGRERLVWKIEQALEFLDDIDEVGLAVARRSATQVAIELHEIANDPDTPPESAQRAQSIRSQILVNLAGGVGAWVVTNGLPALGSAVAHGLPILPGLGG